MVNLQEQFFQKLNQLLYLHGCLYKQHFKNVNMHLKYLVMIL